MKQKAKNNILVLVTGGTFDKEYNLITGELYFQNTHLDEMFRRGRSTLNLTIRTIMMVDSLDMTEADRLFIVSACQRSEYSHIVLTHGTDRMVQTAQLLAEAKLTDKTIVLTGAMIPYAFGNSSDGFFNLGSALAFVQSLPAGVYIAMHGKYFDWDNVKKNTETGYFESIK